MTAINLPINFSTPILSCEKSFCNSLIRASERLISWGRHVYLLKENSLHLQQREAPSKKEIAIKALLVATIALPVFALIIKCLYRLYGAYDREKILVKLEHSPIFTAEEARILEDFRKQDNEQQALPYETLSATIIAKVESLREQANQVAFLNFNGWPKRQTLEGFEKEAADHVTHNSIAGAKCFFAKSNNNITTLPMYVINQDKARIGHLLGYIRKQCSYPYSRLILNGKQLELDAPITTIKNESTLFAS